MLTVRRQRGAQYEPLAAVGAIAVLLALVAVLAWGGPAHAEVVSRVTLRPEAFVKGPSILLGDVADLEGEQAAALAGVEVGAAAQPGSSKRLNAALLASRVAASGIDTRGLVFEGAGTVNATTLSVEVPRAALVESLRAHLLASMPWAAEDVEIDIPAPYDDVVVPEGALVIEWRGSPQYRYVGAGGFRGEIKVDGEVKQTVNLRVNINAYGEVLVAKAEVPRGAPFRPEDFEVRKELMTGANADRIREIEPLLGRIARKSLFPGQAAKMSDFEAPKVIKRSQLVNVETRAGGLLVTSQAVALNDAKIGDMLMCSNPGSQQQFQGLVRDDGTVVVP